MRTDQVQCLRASLEVACAARPKIHGWEVFIRDHTRQRWSTTSSRRAQVSEDGSLEGAIEWANQHMVEMVEKDVITHQVGDLTPAPPQFRAP